MWVSKCHTTNKLREKGFELSVWSYNEGKEGMVSGIWDPDSGWRKRSVRFSSPRAAFPFLFSSTEQLILRPSFSLQLVYLGIFSKTSPEGCFFLPYGCRSCTVDNVNHHRSTKWSLPHRERFLNPVSSHSPAQNHHSKNCYIQLHQTSFPLSSYHMMHRVEFAFTML